MYRKRTYSFFFTVIALLFSVHLFRVFIGSVIFSLGRYIGSHYLLAIFTACVFCLAFLPHLLRRFIREKLFIYITVVGLIITRLAAQLISSHVCLFFISTAGTVFFIWFMIVWSQSLYNRDDLDVVPVMSLAFPAALIIDSATRTLLSSYDLVWRKEFWPFAVILSAAGILYILMLRILPGRRSEEPAGESSLCYALQLFFLGPWLYLAMTNYQNPLSVAAFTGLQEMTAYAIVNTSLIAGAFICVIVTFIPKTRRLAWSILFSIVLVLSTHCYISRIGPVWLWAVTGSLCLWAVPGVIFSISSRRKLRPGIWRTGISFFLALIITVVLVLLGTKLKVNWISTVGAIFLTVPLLGSHSIIRRVSFETLRIDLMLTGLVAFPVILALTAGFFFARPSEPVTLMPGSGKLRVMTYNIHESYSADYRVDLDEMARVIEAQKPDIIGLQEVNRARISNGLIDCLSYLSQRLDMPSVFGPSFDDGQFGNAIISRHPVLSWKMLRYRNNNKDRVCGALHARFQTPSGPVNIYVTHLDKMKDSSIRKKQVGELLGYWDRNPRSIIMGVFNAAPDMPEMTPLYRAGLIDILETAGKKNVTTYLGDFSTPPGRFDYIFLTPDIRFKNVRVIESRASDHVPVVVDIDVAGKGYSFNME